MRERTFIRPAGEIAGRPADARWMRFVRYAWASPNSLIGLAFVPFNGAGRDRLQIVDGVVEVSGPLVAWLLTHCTLMPGGVAAITFGHVVLARDRSMLAATRAHERVHVRQYEQWGPAFIPAYLLASLWAWMRGRGAYTGNAFERAAIEHE